jgi:hypothetical protein
MCHEKYHIDPDIRAIANRLSGLPLARTDGQRERCMTAAQMLLARCCCEGLSFYLENGYADIPTGEVNRLMTKLAAVRGRLAEEALAMLGRDRADDEP